MTAFQLQRPAAHHGDIVTVKPTRKMSGYQSNSAVGELWLQWFSCCINQPAQQRKRQQRRRIDRSMIGEPTNFQHTGHIGSGDVEVGNSRLRAIQSQMQSKGGYETSFTTVKAY